jgi:hypothetical protein
MVKTTFDLSFVAIMKSGASYRNIGGQTRGQGFGPSYIFIGPLVSPLGDTLEMKGPSEDRRISSRINQSETIRIRPADSQHAEEIRTTLNVSWDGLYFATSIGHYFSGMVVYVTRNFRMKDPTSREEQGSVLRVNKLKKGRWGIAVHLPRPAKTDRP